MKGAGQSVYNYPGEVVMMNTVDAWDECIFETPLELASFIEELRAAGKRAFGPEMIGFPAQGEEDKRECG